MGGGGISFPFGEGGQKIKLKAGAAGNKEGKPPIAFSTAAGIASAAQVQPPIAFSTAAGITSAAQGQAPPQGNAAAKSAGTARGTSPPPLQEPSSVTTAPYAMQIPG